MNAKNYSSTNTLKTSRILQYDFKNDIFLNPIRIDTISKSTNKNNFDNVCSDLSDIKCLKKNELKNKNTSKIEFTRIGTYKTEPKKNQSFISLIEKNLEGLRTTDILNKEKHICNLDKNSEISNTIKNNNGTRVKKIK